MLGSRRDESGRITAVVRDVVEIVAILAAGFWALYVFVYEERIKPASEPAEITISGSLTRLGERNGLVQYEYSALVRNVGRSEIYIIATGFSANGERVVALRSPSARAIPDGLSEYDRDARTVAAVSVFRTTQFTNYEDARYANRYELPPGTDVPYSGVFAVKRSAYDAITFYASVAYTKVERRYPTVAKLEDGIIQFGSANHDPAYSTFQITLARASLW